MQEISIREFNKSESDIEALYLLYFQLIDKKMDYDLFKERLLKIIEEKQQVNFLAEKDRKIVGYVAVFMSTGLYEGSYATVAGLVVDKNYKRQGIGRLLMSSAEEWAKNNGASLVKLRSSMIRVDEAHIFYRNIGYEKVKEQACFEKKLAD